MDDVEGHSDVDAVLAERPREQLIGAGELAKQRIPVGIEPRRRARGVALLVDESTHGRLQLWTGRFEFSECALEELVCPSCVLGHERHHFDGSETRDALWQVQVSPMICCAGAPRSFLLVNVLIDLVDASAFAAGGRRAHIGRPATVLGTALALSGAALSAAGVASLGAPQGGDR
jgi:hypothetical protein